MEAALQCCSTSCRRFLPRKVKRCPFCGALQNNPDYINERTPVPPKDQAVSGVPAHTKKSETGSSATGSGKPTPVSQSLAPKPPKPDVPPPPPPPPPKWRKWMVGGVVVTAFLVIRTVFWSSSDVKVEASPNSWTSVKLSDFPAGTRIVFSAPGAFRVRTVTTPPVLVNGESGDADLSSLPRDGVEIRSATGATLDVVVRKSD
jgi:hypothetical protein